MNVNLNYLLRKYDIKPRKKWSQNFLISPSVIKEMTSYGKGRVLEIGPGLGFITVELAKKADKVIAIEKDRKFVHILKEEYSFGNVEVIQGDVTEMDLPPFDRVISNIPYHISSEITFKLLEHSFELGVLSYQKEFAQRLVQKIPSPQVSRLSIMIQVRADCEITKYVSRKAYYPVPKTDCALVKIIPHEKIIDAFFDQVIRALFTHKRKTVRNALLSSRDILGTEKEVIQSAQFPYPDRKVWSLTIEEMQVITSALRAEEYLCSTAEEEP